MENTRLKLKKVSKVQDLTLQQYAGVMTVVTNNNVDNKDISSGDLAEYYLKMALAINDHLKESDLRKASSNVINNYAEGILKLLSVPGAPELKEVFRVGKVWYGLEPNVQAMEFGAFHDISKLSREVSIDNIALMMAIMYRPITKRYGFKLYSTVSYEDEDDASVRERAEIFKGALNGGDVRSLMTFFARALNQV